jgi:hypothetical protein
MDLAKRLLFFFSCTTTRHSILIPTKVLKLAGRIEIAPALIENVQQKDKDFGQACRAAFVNQYTCMRFVKYLSYKVFVCSSRVASTFKQSGRDGGHKGREIAGSAVKIVWHQC